MTLKESFFITKEKLESWKMVKQKRFESGPSLLLKLEDLDEQVKFLEMKFYC